MQGYKCLPLAGRRGGAVIKVLDLDKVTPIDGVRYLVPPDDAVLTARDGKVSLECGDVPIPLLIEDYEALDAPYPSYDAVGRGIYQALRTNPDCRFGERYARILRDFYPHYISEIATNLLMLDSKDVEVPYVDRKINLLKILWLLEPQNAHFPFQIGLAFMDKGLRASALHLSTINLYKSRDFLLKALEISPGNPEVSRHAAEVCYFLGRYEDAVGFWQTALVNNSGAQAEDIAARIARVEMREIPMVPAVDYLTAVGIAFQHFQADEIEEAASILQDVLDDPVFRRDFIMPDIWYVLGESYEKMSMPKYAEEYYSEALGLDEGHQAAREALQRLRG